MLNNMDYIVHGMNPRACLYAQCNTMAYGGCASTGWYHPSGGTAIRIPHNANSISHRAQVILYLYLINIKLFTSRSSLHGIIYPIISLIIEW